MIDCTRVLRGPRVRILLPPAASLQTFGPFQDNKSRPPSIWSAPGAHARGTDSSNPSPSRGESRANLTSSSWRVSASIVRITLLGLLLVAIFVLWLIAAEVIYQMTLGPEPPASLGAFVRDVFSTDAGWTMIVVGVGVGFLFALLALVVSVVSFPLLVDREVGVDTAALTSIRAVMANPAPMAAWGLIVAGGLVIGSIPFLLGLIIVMPVLGHATWHLYRAVVPR